VTEIVRTVVFRGPDEKAAWLDAMATLDARLPETRALARRFATARYADPNDLGMVARQIARFVRDSIRYVRDPAGEEFSDSDRILLRGYGDCDDKARLFVALCRSVGIAARTRPCFEGDDFVHVQAEVFIDGSWQVVELIVKDLEVGMGAPRKARVLT
jgi:transglutaminase-like putative cysteine protease